MNQNLDVLYVNVFAYACINIRFEINHTSCTSGFLLLDCSHLMAHWDSVFTWKVKLTLK